MDRWMDREKSPMLTMMVFGSDIIIFIFILKCFNFSKNPYYSYGHKTSLFQKEVKTKSKVTFLVENTKEVSSTVPSTELPFNPLPSFLPLNYLWDSVPPPPAPLLQPISEEFIPLPHSWSYFSSLSTRLSSSHDLSVKSTQDKNADLMLKHRCVNAWSFLHWRSYTDFPLPHISIKTLLSSHSCHSITWYSPNLQTFCTPPLRCTHQAVASSPALSHVLAHHYIIFLLGKPNNPSFKFQLHFYIPHKAFSDDFIFLPFLPSSLPQSESQFST